MRAHVLVRVPSRLLSLLIVAAAVLLAACAPASSTGGPSVGKPAVQSDPARDSATGTAVSKTANPKLAEMIQKAAEEKEVIFQAPDPGVPDLDAADMLSEMSAVVKKYFGVDVTIKLNGALSWPASTAKALTEIKSGNPPSFDLMNQTPVSGSALYAENAVEEIPWLELFPWLTAQDLAWNGTALVYSHNFYLPAYNTRLVQSQDVPKSWDDLLEPKWRGRLGALIYTDPWLFLSQPSAWGKEKTLDYVRRLSEVNPKLGRTPEVMERIVSGENALTLMVDKERVEVANKRAGATVAPATQVSPALIWVNLDIIPKGARHRNAAALVAASMLTEEGQKILEKYHNSTSMARPNTPAARFAQEHQTLAPDIEWQLQNGSALHTEFEAILVKK
jgi:ABC-type Fe3+ transport system substrate-binding protein